MTKNTQTPAPDLDARVAALMDQVKLVASTQALLGGEFDYGHVSKALEIGLSSLEQMLRAELQKPDLRNSVSDSECLTALQNLESLEKTYAGTLEPIRGVLTVFAQGRFQKPALHEPVTDAEIEEFIRVKRIFPHLPVSGYRRAMESFLQGRAKPALQANAAAVGPTKVCPGIPRKGCDYLAVCNSICNKCGQVHHSHQLATASVPARAQEVMDAANYKTELAAETPMQKGTRASLAVQGLSKAFDGLGSGRKDRKTKVTDEMVSRFLMWKLPAGFAPDCGISFKSESDYEHPVYGRTKYEPTGTNLLSADQAREMLEHVLATPPNATKGDEASDTNLSAGYTGSTCVTNKDGGTISLHYETGTEADAAFAIICKQLDTAIRAAQKG